MWPDSGLSVISGGYLRTFRSSGAPGRHSAAAHEGLYQKSETERLPQFASDSGDPGIFEGRENVCEGRSAVSDDCDGFLGKCRS